MCCCEVEYVELGSGCVCGVVVSGVVVVVEGEVYEKGVGC